MKLSRETIDILKNFQSINPSIVIRPGNMLMTQRQDFVVARAKVSEEFPRVAPLVDLKKFLALYSLGGEDTDVDFTEEKIIISQDDYRSNLAYSPEGLIDSPPEGMRPRLKNKDVQFTLKQEVWERVSAAMSIMSFSEFAFVGEDGVLSIQGLSTRIENGESDTYSANIGETEHNFRCIMNASHMRLIPGDYDVTISRDGIVHFKGGIAEYWIIMSAKSSFDG